MNGLLWKDLVLLKSGILYIGMFAVVFCILFSDSSVMCIISSILFSSLVSSSFAWDEQCQWSQFAVSAGISRKELMIQKYSVGVVFVAIGTIIGFIVTLAIMAFDGIPDIIDIGVVSATGFVLGLIVSFISLAVNYWTGNSVKAQYVCVIVLMVSIALLVAGTVIASDLLGGNMIAVLGIMLIFLAIASATSYRLSWTRFSRRDL